MWPFKRKPDPLLAGSVFDGRFWPLTTGFAFIEAPAEKIVEAYLKWDTRTNANRVAKQTAGLNAALLSLCPLFRRGPTRKLFLPTQSRWTACFDNGAQGTDPGSWDHLGCDLVNARTIHFHTEPHTLRREEESWTGRCGCYQFALYEHDAPNRCRRYIRNAVEGVKRWEYHTEGEPLEFEVAPPPGAKNRVTEEMVLLYLRHFGIEARSDAFYIANALKPAYLINIPTNALERRGISLAEAQAYDRN